MVEKIKDLNMFAGSKAMKMTIYKHDIQDERQRAYSDFSGQAFMPYLSKINRNVDIARLKRIMQSCLLAKNYQYKDLLRMFERI
jgi:hypothetical protein